LGRIGERTGTWKKAKKVLGESGKKTGNKKEKKGDRTNDEKVKRDQVGEKIKGGRFVIVLQKKELLEKKGGSRIIVKDKPRRSKDKWCAQRWESICYLDGSESTEGKEYGKSLWGKKGHWETKERETGKTTCTYCLNLCERGDVKHHF